MTGSAPCTILLPFACILVEQTPGPQPTFPSAFRFWMTLSLTMDGPGGTLISILKLIQGLERCSEALHQVQDEIRDTTNCYRVWSGKSGRICVYPEQSTARPIQCPSLVFRERHRKQTVDIRQRDLFETKLTLNHRPRCRVPLGAHGRLSVYSWRPSTLEPGRGAYKLHAKSLRPK